MPNEWAALLIVAVLIPFFIRLPRFVGLVALGVLGFCLATWPAPSVSSGRWVCSAAIALSLTVLFIALRISVAPGQTHVLQAALAESRWVRSGRLSVQKLLGSLILHVDLSPVGRGRWLFWARQPRAQIELEMRLYVSGAALDGARRVRLHVCDKWGSPAWLSGASDVTPKGAKGDWLCWPPGVRRVRRLLDDDRLRAAIEGLQNVSIRAKRGRLVIKMEMRAPVIVATTGWPLQRETCPPLAAPLAAAGWPDRTLDLIETIVTRWAELTQTAR